VAPGYDGTSPFAASDAAVAVISGAGLVTASPAEAAAVALASVLPDEFWSLELLPEQPVAATIAMAAIKA
jgi:hypothetical protein